ncbi:hypothetical protein LXA43DRAFT_1069593 [Ganoderma leucocontextum]|nr:hypothetical protein LXA43DRAFT_1069593 [Ganoderma leucocontextum]
MKHRGYCTLHNTVVYLPLYICLNCALALSGSQENTSHPSGTPRHRIGAPSLFVTPLHRPIHIQHESIFTTPGGVPTGEDESLPTLRTSTSESHGTATDVFSESESQPATPRSEHIRPLGTPGHADPPVPETPEEKVDFMFDQLKAINWTIGDLLYYVFCPDESKIQHTLWHSTIIGMFLSGRTWHTAAQVVNFWLEDDIGRTKHDHTEFKWRYSPSKAWVSIKHADVAMTTMAVQLTEEHLVREQRFAVRGANGLHGSTLTERGRHELSWADISGRTVAEPLALHLVERLATPAPRKDVSGAVVIRKSRPANLVATEILSSLDFAHTHFARRLPAARGALYFALGAERGIFDYNSRVTHTQSHSMTYTTLAQLSKAHAEELKRLSQDESRAGIGWADNIQQLARVHEQRLGQESTMQVGFSATWSEAFDFDPAALDVDDRLDRITQNLRSQVTIDSLSAMIDYAHLDVAFKLQWLQVLTNYVPCLARYKPDVAALFKTEGAKLVVPLRQTQIHCLAPAVKNETIMTELRDAMVDFFAQLGQQPGQYKHHLIPFGGDGLTYEKYVHMKNLLQFQEDEFQRFNLLYPFLETWHAQWTYLSLIYEAHYGDYLTADPSTLGHSATKIDQKRPPNLKKKIDYYPCLYIAYIVLDARMLDCWRIDLQGDQPTEIDDMFAYFEALDAQNKVPALSKLREHARKLHRMIVPTRPNRRGLRHYMEGMQSDGGWVDHGPHRVSLVQSIRGWGGRKVSCSVVRTYISKTRPLLGLPVQDAQDAQDG